MKKRSDDIPDSIIVAGNGIKKNRNLQKVINEYYKKIIIRSNKEEDSCLGAVIHLSVGLNLNKKYRDAILKMQ